MFGDNRINNHPHPVPPPGQGLPGSASEVLRHLNKFR
jgi:hypothetical protein